MNIYIIDGSEKAFYTAVFSACTDKTCLITSGKNLQLTLDAKVVTVLPDEAKIARVKKKLREYDKECLREISLVLRRGCNTREMTALEYLRTIVERRAPVRDMLALPAVLEMRSEMKKVTLETHRFTGFLRFMEGENCILYAPFSPDNDILDLILPHFMRRLKNQPFVIHDVARQKAALYNKRDCLITATDEKVQILLSEYEKGFQKLWQEYYRSATVSQRPHEKQMRGYMPVRYWKFMPEKNEN